MYIMWVFGCVPNKSMHTSSERGLPTQSEHEIRHIVQMLGNALRKIGHTTGMIEKTRKLFYNLFLSNELQHAQHSCS